MSAFTRRNVLIVLIDSAVWASWSVLCGYVVHRISSARLSRDTGVFRLRGWERSGRFYERCFRIKRWKDRLPDAGEVFGGGVPKRALAVRDRARLERFAMETRRAERTHWLIVAAAPWFFLWNPWWLGLVMVGYGVIANIPCVAIQRYNRARLTRALEKASAPSTA